MKTTLELAANIIDLVGKRNKGGAPAINSPSSPASGRSSTPRSPAPSHDNLDEPYDDTQF